MGGDRIVDRTGDMGGAGNMTGGRTGGDGNGQESREALRLQQASKAQGPQRPGAEPSVFKDFDINLEAPLEYTDTAFGADTGLHPGPGLQPGAVAWGQGLSMPLGGIAPEGQDPTRSESDGEKGRSRGKEVECEGGQERRGEAVQLESEAELQAQVGARFARAVKILLESLSAPPEIVGGVPRAVSCSNVGSVLLLGDHKVRSPPVRPPQAEAATR